MPKCLKPHFGTGQYLQGKSGLHSATHSDMRSYAAMSFWRLCRGEVCCAFQLLVNRQRDKPEGETPQFTLLLLFKELVVLVEAALPPADFSNAEVAERKGLSSRRFRNKRAHASQGHSCLLPNSLHNPLWHVEGGYIGRVENAGLWHKYCLG